MAIRPSLIQMPNKISAPDQEQCQPIKRSPRWVLRKKKKSIFYCLDRNPPLSPSLPQSYWQVGSLRIPPHPKKPQKKENYIHQIIQLQGKNKRWRIKPWNCCLCCCNLCSRLSNQGILIAPPSFLSNGATCKTWGVYGKLLRCSCHSPPSPTSPINCLPKPNQPKQKPPSPLPSSIVNDSDAQF